MWVTFRWAALATAAALVGAGVFGGLDALLTVAVLGVLEVSLSFDNAVVNARVLQRMDPLWQRLFLTVGILIAVFGMRLVLPILIVAVTGHLAPGAVFDLAVHDPGSYGEHLEAARYSIYAFGGAFLGMIFLDFVFDQEKDSHWLGWLERPLVRIGKLNQLSVIVMLITVAWLSNAVGADVQVTVLFSGLVGMATYLVVNGLDSLFESDDAGTGATASTAARAGLAAFLYLEVLDASFSFDGAIGAFAISDEIFVIALGLGIGAFWIRSLTIALVRKGTLQEYVYLEHGAMWAIGVLATIMLAQTLYEVSEAVTGLTGVGFISAAVLSSILERRRGEPSEPVVA